MEDCKDGKTSTTHVEVQSTKKKRIPLPLKIPESIASNTSEVSQIVNENKMVVEQHETSVPQDSSYELEKYKENQLFIFNHENFKVHSRVGTRQDVEALCNTFKYLGFVISCYNDWTKNQIITTLKDYKKKDLSQCGCVVVAILTHGYYDDMLSASDESYSVKEIIDLLTQENSPLAGKPKVFIIQACRGDEDPSGAHVDSPETPTKKTESKITQCIPSLEQDVLILHSCYAGKPSYRDGEKGSWFIQPLCKYLKMYGATCDIDDIMLHVKREVAHDKDLTERIEGSLSTTISKQMPSSTSTLTKKLFLCSSGNEVDGPLDGSSPENEINLRFCEINFKFLKACLHSHIEEHPDDIIAKTYEELAETCGDSADFRRSKASLSKIILEHFVLNGVEFKERKYIDLK